MNRLSIISTLYKTAAYLPRCIETLLQQDLAPDEYEIILVDDGSPENDLEIAQDYASRYDNIRVISQPNKGLAGARNTGLAAATGQYVSFVDPDDYIETNSFRALLDQMDDKHLDMLRFDYHVVDEQYAEISKVKDAQMIDYSSGIMTGPQFLVSRLGYACYVWAFIYRRSVIEENHIAFREGDYFDDTVWLPQVLCASQRVDTIDWKRYYYLQRGNSLVNTVSVEATVRKLDAQLVIVERLQEQRQRMEASVQSWYTGMNSKTALSILTSAAVTCPNEYRRYLKNLKQLGIFPLHIFAGTQPQKVKCMALNLCPCFFCKLMYLHNIKRKGGS